MCVWGGGGRGGVEGAEPGAGAGETEGAVAEVEAVCVSRGGAGAWGAWGREVRGIPRPTHQVEVQCSTGVISGMQYSSVISGVQHPTIRATISSSSSSNAGYYMGHT